MLLADVTQLKVLVDAGRWNDVSSALKTIADQVELPSLAGEEVSSEPLKKMEDPFKAAMSVYSLTLATVHYTQIGSAKQANATLNHLHMILDQAVLDDFSDGCINVGCLCNHQHIFS